MKVLNIAITGCGYIAGKHALALRNTEGCRLAAVYDLDVAAAERMAARYRVPVYRSYQELVASPGIDVISICTPADTHYDLGVRAAGHGKHLLVEKPLAVGLQDADDLLKACEKAGVSLAVAHQNRFKAPVRALKQALEKGLLGKISHGSAVLRWNRNIDYYRQSPWRGDPSRGGGVLLNQAIHNIDLLQWMLGPASTVYGQTGSTTPGIGVEESALAVIRFRSGAMGVIEACSSVYPESLEETLAVFGSRGTVILGGRSLSKVLRWEVEEAGGAPPDFAADPADPGGYVPLFANLAECIRNGGRPLVDGREGRKALEIINAIKQSDIDGRPFILHEQTGG